MAIIWYFFSLCVSLSLRIESNHQSASNCNSIRLRLHFLSCWCRFHDILLFTCFVDLFILLLMPLNFPSLSSTLISWWFNQYGIWFALFNCSAMYFGFFLLLLFPGLVVLHIGESLFFFFNYAVVNYEILRWFRVANQQTAGNMFAKKSIFPEKKVSNQLTTLNGATTALYVCDWHFFD